jgi:hypothetical protein
MAPMTAAAHQHHCKTPNQFPHTLISPQLTRPFDTHHWVFSSCPLPTTL